MDANRETDRDAEEARAGKVLVIVIFIASVWIGAMTTAMVHLYHKVQHQVEASKP